MTGLIASLIGLGLGVVAALGLKALLKAFGIVLPPAPLVFEARTAVVAIAVGVGVTLVSAIVPARRAVQDRSRGRAHGAARGPGCGRAPADGRARDVFGVAGIVLVLVRDEQGVGRAGRHRCTGHPCRHRPALAAAGRPALERARTSAGRGCSAFRVAWGARTPPAIRAGPPRPPPRSWLAYRSSRRSRCSGASLSASAKNSVDSALSADYIVSGEGGFSKSVVPAVSRLHGVKTTTVVYQGQFEVGSSLSTLVAATPAHLANTVTLHVTAGSGAPAMAAGELLVDSNTASTHHLRVGSVVPVKFAQTGSSTMTDRRHLQAEPAARQLPHRRRLLPLAL